MQPAQVHHQSLFEHAYTYAPIGISLLSVDGTMMKVNPALCAILGYTQEELTGRTFADITHPNDLAKDRNHVSKLLDGTISCYETEKRYIRKNREPVWASVHVSLVRDEKTAVPLYLISHIIDITDKKATETKLLESEELYDLISNNALDIISYNTPDGICRYISPSVRDVLGYEPEELIGNNTIEHYHPEDVKRLQSMPLADNELMTYRVRHKNGQYVWFETTVKLIRDDRGNVVKAFGIGRNVTERKKHEHNLAEAQSIASLGSWEWDIVHDNITLSDQVHRIFNVDKHLVPADPRELLPLIHANDRQRLMDGIGQALQGGDLSLEVRHVQPDEAVKFLHIRGTVMFADDGAAIEMHGTVQDVTDRKKIEMKLHETIERYTSLKKYNHDAIFSLDMEGNIINSNMAAQTMTGLPIEDMAGLNFSQFLGGNVRLILSEAQDTASIQNHIDRIKHKDGHAAEVLTTIAPIIIHEATVGYYIIAKDITEQKKLLIAKDTAEKTNKAKSEFLAMMSHEIRTPMNGVIGMTELLLATTELTAQQTEYVGIIQKSGETLLNIINDILDFSKIESGTPTISEEKLDVRTLVAETYDLFLTKSKAKRLEMKVSIDPDVPANVIGDPVRLKQVITNLVGNAVKFTNAGSVTLEIHTVARERSKVKLQFTVKDTGIGIPPDKLNLLFEPFSQLDNFMTRKTEGTGLGLAISKKLVEQMDGDIWVEQSEGPGTTFAFTVSLQEEDGQPAKSPRQNLCNDAAPPLSLNILVAEDNEINQMVLKKMIETQGHRVRIAENGNEVLLAVAGETFDIIFMDIQMPGMNGLDASIAIKEMLPPGKCPYIVAVTANALQGDRETCLAAGMDDYISKPVKSEMVHHIIWNYVQDMPSQ